jgi:hypothetical protein
MVYAENTISSAAWVLEESPELYTNLPVRILRIPGFFTTVLMYNRHQLVQNLRSLRQQSCQAWQESGVM